MKPSTRAPDAISPGFGRDEFLDVTSYRGNLRGLAITAAIGLFLWHFDVLYAMVHHAFGVSYEISQPKQSWSRLWAVLMGGSGAVFHFLSLLSIYIKRPRAIETADEFARLGVPGHRWPLARVYMPAGEQLVLMYCETGDEPQLALHTMNHNVYRLNVQSQIVWQVQREDTNHPPDWWESLHRQARAEGLDGAREPFMRIWVENRDGSFQSDPDGKTPALVQHWTPGCTLHLDGSAYQHYILDPDTGIAKNVTKLPVRPW